MRIEKINLSEQYRLQGGEVTAFVGEKPFDRGHEDWKRPAMIIAPGGAYLYVSKREAEPIAFRFLAKGFQVFVLNYLCAPTARYPEQLLELACTVDYIRKNAERFGVNPEEVFAVGFSAGGHLVGNLSTDYMQAVEEYGEAIDCKLTAAGLGYPVTSPVYKYARSFESLTSGVEDESEKERILRKVNLVDNVSERTVPTFIWATAEDQVVPVANSTGYAHALAKQGIPFELHIYPQGEHGLSTCDKEINPDEPYLAKAEGWMDAFASFCRLYIKENF